MPKNLSAENLLTMLKFKHPDWKLKISPVKRKVVRQAGQQWFAVCQHETRLTGCKICGGASICEHNRHRTSCKDCKGGAICMHDRRRTCCKECRGGSICKHNRERTSCRDCNGGTFCMHDTRRARCRECRGGSICEHNRERAKCKNCKGSSLCEAHNRRRERCYDCNPNAAIFCNSNGEPWNNVCPVMGNAKYDGFCTHCFVNLFPNDPRCETVRTKSKELAVVAEITKLFDGFLHDKPLYVDLEGGCCASKRRIDLRTLVGNTMLCIEIDEFQHKQRVYREDDPSRYNDLFVDFSGKYVFIRYNPDPYKIAKENQDPPMEERIEALVCAIKHQMARIEKGENGDFLELHHLFYDEN